MTMVFSNADAVREAIRSTYVCERCHDIVEVTHPGGDLRHGHREFAPRRARRCRGHLRPFYRVAI